MRGDHSTQLHQALVIDIMMLPGFGMQDLIQCGKGTVASTGRCEDGNFRLLIQDELPQSGKVSGVAKANTEVQIKVPIRYNIHASYTRSKWYCHHRQTLQKRL